MSDDWLESIVFIGLIAIFVVIAFFISDAFICVTKDVPAVVVSRAYTPSQTSTGVGTGMTSNGKMGTVVTTSTTSESWNAIISLSGEVVSAETSPQRWATLKEGEPVTARIYHGKFTGIRWRIFVL